MSNVMHDKVLLHTGGTAQKAGEKAEGVGKKMQGEEKAGK